MTQYRILTFDGGGQLELTSTLLVREIEKRRPGFLAKTDMLAGTSAGGMLSLMLATQDDPADRLPLAINFWEQFFFLTMNTFIGSALAFVGLGAFFNNEKLEDFFAQDDVLGEKTLAELKKKVVITSFELDGLAKQTGRRTWKPKIFHNLGLPDDPDYQQKAREVAVRTGAAPIFFPIVDGFVDGGVFANNPAMCAVTQVCDAFRRRAKGSRKRIPTIQGVLDDIKVLSIGVGQTQEYVSVGNANWGYFNWMFNPLDPLLLVNMLLQGDEMAVNFQVDHLLPEGNYHRLSPFYDRKSPIPFSVNIEEMKKTVASDQSQALIDETIAWIDQSGWLDEGNMASQQGQPASDDKQKT